MNPHIRKASGFFLISVLILGSYQNCAPLKAAQVGASDASSLTTSSVIRDADISWSMRQSTAIFNRFDRASRWPSMQAAGVHLYPPVIPSSQLLNTDASGIKEISGGGEFLRFGPDSSMSPAIADTSDFVFGEFSIILLVKDVNPPLDVVQPVRIFDMIPADGSASGRLVLDIVSVNGGVDVSIADWYSGADYATRSLFLPPEKAKGVLAIAIRFSRDAKEMMLAVNGEISSRAMILNGTVPQLAIAARNFVLHAPAGQWGSRGTFLIGEIGIHKRALSDFDLIRTSAELAALYNGMVDIPIPTPTPIVIGTPTPVPTATPDQGLNGASLYTTNCQSCHNPLASSSKRGRSVTDISNAINTIPTMAGLSGLSQAERAVIAEALK